VSRSSEVGTVPEPIVIRAARRSDAERLSAIAFRAKAHWGYDAALLELWRPDLTFTIASIAEDEVFVAERAGEALGVVALSYAGDVAALEGLWIDPPAMGEGLGRRLFARAVAAARTRGARALVVEAAPNAEGFYLRMGARCVGTVPARPAGRRLPKLVLEL